MLPALISLTAVGLTAGLCLAWAANRFNVQKDPRIQTILDSLPGSNCGACGYPGCGAMSSAIADGKAGADACPVTNAAQKSALAAILGSEDCDFTAKVVRLACGGNSQKCPPTADYSGLEDCRVMALTAGGGKACIYGCLGGGNCVSACLYEAIEIDTSGLPVVHEDKCTACGLCAKACPRSLLKVMNLAEPVYIKCKSIDKGPDVRKVCSSGCIACKICEKTCPEGAITASGFLAAIDPQKCTGCGLCLEKCPTKCIALAKG